jgi:heme/copper-type cytochrome/quinol oxidase subunit 2
MEAWAQFTIIFGVVFGVVFTVMWRFLRRKKDERRKARDEGI